MKKLILGIFLAVWWCGNHACAQDIAAKTNLLYWATTTPNIGMEFGLGEQTTLELTGSYNPWTLDKEQNKKLKHWLVMPEFRYWLCERFNGHFFGIHTGYTFYNISGVRIPFQGKETADHRYQGWATGLGISYGYSWILGKRWNIEATIGFGYAYSNYDKYDCATCGRFKGESGQALLRADEGRHFIDLHHQITGQDHEKHISHSAFIGAGVQRGSGTRRERGQLPLPDRDQRPGGGQTGP